MRTKLNWDLLGSCAATACMIHCLAFPLIVAMLPFLSGASAATIDVDEQVFTAENIDASGDCPRSCCSSPVEFWTHVALFTAVAPIGLIAWGNGYRQHGQLSVVILGSCGIALLLLALIIGSQLFAGAGEMYMTVLGSICMVAAHLWNRRACSCRNCASSQGKPAELCGSPSV